VFKVVKETKGAILTCSCFQWRCHCYVGHKFASCS